ncbi:MAG: hypothetical protein ACK5Q5_16070 [Planctomycetaceae bacterium]
MSAGQPLLIAPRGPGEVLDHAGSIVRRIFPQALRAVLIGYLPWSILCSLLLIPGAQEFSRGVLPPPEVVRRHLIWMTVWIVGDAFLLRQFSRGWLLALVGAELQGKKIRSRSAAGTGLRRLPATVVATLLTLGPFYGFMWLMTATASQQQEAVLTMMIASPLVMLIGIPLATLGYLAPAIAVLERRGPFSAMARSVRLTTSGFGTVILVVVVLFIVRFFAGIVPATIPNIWIQTTLNATFLALLAIFEASVEGVLYFQLRCRREDYDLELLAREVELMGSLEVESVPPRLGGALLDPKR